MSHVRQKMYVLYLDGLYDNNCSHVLGPTGPRVVLNGFYLSFLHFIFYLYTPQFFSLFRQLSMVYLQRAECNIS